MYQSNKIFPQAIRSIDSATFTGSYQALGTQLTYPVRIMKIINNSDEDVTISMDGGTTDHDFVPANTYCVYDFGTQKGASSDAMDLPGGIGLMIKGSAGTGLVYLITYSALTPTMNIPGV